MAVPPDWKTARARGEGDVGDAVFRLRREVEDFFLFESEREAATMFYGVFS